MKIRFDNVLFSFREKGRFCNGIFLYFPNVYIVRSIFEVNFDLFHKELDGFYEFNGFKFFNYSYCRL
ncbi:hypothetical protein D8W73_10280 [Citrobacter amalonaticus]|nr:hypothetical protein [Citrobacter amalonaticus]